MRVGILGGGQLGRMLALAAHNLGIEVRLFEPTADACAGQVAPLISGDFASEADLLRFADGLDVVTLEWENVPLAAADFLAARLPFYPPPGELAISQDRLHEKTLFRELGIETAPFRPVDGAMDLSPALMALGMPAILKARSGGYDGRGQWPLQGPADFAPAQRGLSEYGPAILESFVGFQRELSIIAVRSVSGEVAFYPLVENHHREGILRVSYAPAPDLTPELQAQAQRLAIKVMDAVDHVGVLAIELFQTGDRLLANEMAPRVHNSGHWSIEGAATNQFENHLRAVTGLPLGSTETRGANVMVNLIGETPELERMLALPGAHVHLYGKSPRPGRKLGHVTFCAASPDEARSAAHGLTKMIATDSSPASLD